MGAARDEPKTPGSAQRIQSSPYSYVDYECPPSKNDYTFWVYVENRQERVHTEMLLIDANSLFPYEISLEALIRSSNVGETNEAMRFSRITLESYPSDDSHRVTILEKSYLSQRDVCLAKDLQINLWLSLLLLLL